MRRLLFCIVGLLLSSASMAQQLRHTIERGETFELIARRYNISVNELMAVNPGLDGCFVGMEINIPANGRRNETMNFVTPMDYVLMEKALNYYKEGKYKKAASVYDDVIKTTPSAAAYLGRGLCYYNRKKYKSAIEDFEKSLTKLSNGCSLFFFAIGSHT